MRALSKRIVGIALLIAGLCGCNGNDSPEYDLKDIKLEEWPASPAL